MRRTVAVLLSLLLVAGACSSSESESTPVGTAGWTTVPTSSSPTTLTPPTAPPTTVPLATSPPDGLEADPVSLQGAGPYEVGVTTLELPTGNLVEVFYPADDSAAGSTDSYQVRTFLPEALRGIIPDETDDSYEIAAQRDGDASADGPFPLVLFSHGFAAFRVQSSELSRHVASWGMVVASPDHPSRNLESQLSSSEVEVQTSSEDIRATRTLVTSVTDGPLAGLIDDSRVAVSGHSAGGGTTLDVAADEGIAGYVSYASGASDDAVMPGVPSLFMAGSLDEIVEPSRTVDAHEGAQSPSWLWVLDDAGHLVFSDLCAIGEGQGGLIAMAESAGIGEAVPEDLRRLATDGCEPPNLPVIDVWPAVNQASVAFYRLVFGLEDETEGRGLDSLDLDGVDVTIEVSDPA
ncbi:MAG: alpha/beta hydrolase family protein [Acidimicrobiales bacterium]